MNFWVLGHSTLFIWSDFGRPGPEPSQNGSELVSFKIRVRKNPLTPQGKSSQNPKNGVLAKMAEITKMAIFRKTIALGYLNFHFSGFDHF